MRSSIPQCWDLTSKAWDLGLGLEGLGLGPAVRVSTLSFDFGDLRLASLVWGVRLESRFGSLSFGIGVWKELSFVVKS
jgi:hypothetical protein